MDLGTALYSSYSLTHLLSRSTEVANKKLATIPQHGNNQKIYTKTFSKRLSQKSTRISHTNPHWVRKWWIKSALVLNIKTEWPTKPKVFYCLCVVGNIFRPKKWARCKNERKYNDKGNILIIVFIMLVVFYRKSPSCIYHTWRAKGYNFLWSVLINNRRDMDWGNISNCTNNEYNWVLWRYDSLV